MTRLVLITSLWSALALADIAAPPPEPQPLAQAEVAPAPAPAPDPVPEPAPQHPQGIEKMMPSGVIDGGWSYVLASYGVAFLGVGLYALSLVLRRPKPGVTS